MKQFFYSAFFLFATSLISTSAFAQVEWKDVAHIFYNNCATCHRAGEIGAPYFNVMGFSNFVNSYNLVNVRPDVSSGKMPPWKADPNYRHFIGERILSPADTTLIAQWMDAGAPAGDTLLAPPLPTFPVGSQLGTPDLVLHMAQPYVVPGDNNDHYYVFVLPTGFLQDKKLKGIEFRAGNNNAVHHSFVWYDNTGQAAQLDSQTPEYGFPAFGSPGANATLMNVYAPGMEPRLFPHNMAMTVPSGSDILLQIHYAPTTVSTTDSSWVNLFFSTDASPREVKTRMFGENALTNGGNLFIPANTVSWFTEQSSPSLGDISMISIAAHMHLIGKSFKIFAVSPSSDTIPILYIPSWDFQWQLLYNFQWLTKLYDNSEIYAVASYDNTANNLNNPNDPPLDIAYGTSSTDEMMKFFMIYADYLPGDENMIIDSSLVDSPIIGGMVNTPQLYPIVPNPSIEEFTINYYLPYQLNTKIYISDMLGRLVKVLDEGEQSGIHSITLDAKEFASGTYFCTMQNGTLRIAKKFMVQH